MRVWTSVVACVNLVKVLVSIMISSSWSWSQVLWYRSWSWRFGLVYISGCCCCCWRWWWWWCCWWWRCSRYSVLSARVRLPTEKISVICWAWFELHDVTCGLCVWVVRAGQSSGQTLLQFLCVWSEIISLWYSLSHTSLLCYVSVHHHFHRVCLLPAKNILFHKLMCSQH